MLIQQSNVLFSIGFWFPRLLAWETIWNLLCLMSEIYPLTSHDHITRKMINFRNVVIICVPKGVSNFGHTITKHVHKCKWSYKCKGKFQMFYNNIYNGNICHTKVCETSDFSQRGLCTRPIMKWIWWLIYAATINMAYSEYGSNIHHGLVINWTHNNLLAKLSPVPKLWLGPLALLVW